VQVLLLNKESFLLTRIGREGDKTHMAKER
jgi:hypothetical protein